MAKGKITKNEVAEFDKIVQGFKDIGDALKSDIELIKKLTKESRKIQKALSQSKGFKEVNDNTKKATTNINNLTDAEKKLTTSTKRLVTEISKEGKELAIVAERTRRARKANRDYAKSVIDAGKRTSRFASVMKSFGFQFNLAANLVSNFASRVLRGFVRTLKSSFNVIAGFEQGMADVKAITKASGEEFEQLSKQARKLGGSTKFTAVQVAQLEKEYAKLGFSTKEIINASEATLDLAAATGSDLARAAEVAGKTLRGFGLDARKTQRVTDVMAESFTSSALDIENFAESMKFVAPVAKVANTSIEETTALLGILADAGIIGSMAGTSLRKIFGELVGEGGDLGEVLTELSKKELTLADAQGLVGERARTSLLVILDNIEKLPLFTRALENAGGAAEKMADIQLDTLTGKLTELKSAIQELTLEVGDNEKAIGGAKDIIDTATNTVQAASSALDKHEGKWAKISGRIIRFVPILGNVTRGYDKYSLVAEIAAKKTEEIGDEIEETTTKTIDFKTALSDLFTGLKTGFSELLGLEGDDIEKIVNLTTLEAELKKLNDSRKLASIDEIAAIDAEIFKIEEKIEAFNKNAEVLKELSKLYKELEIESKKIITDEEIEDVSEALIDLGDAWEDVAKSGTNTNEILSQRGGERKQEELDNIIEITNALKEKNQLEKDLANEAFNFISAINARRTENLEAANNAESIALEARFKREFDLNDEAVQSEEDRRKKELEIQKRHEAEKIALEEKTAEASLKLRRRAARLDKAQALFNIGIDTAAAVIKYAANPVTAFLVPWIIGLGLAQGAEVAATPIPQFAKGTDSSPAGKAVVGEEGRELMIDKKGNVKLSPSKASIVDLKAGTKIIPHDATESLLAQPLLGGTIGGEVGLLAEIKASNQLLKSINRKPVASSTLTPAGILTAVRSGSSTNKKLDKYFK